MDTPTHRFPRATAARGNRTANDRLKETFETKLGLSLVLATTLHVVVFQAWPEMRADVWAGELAETEIIPLPEVDIPEAPEPLVRPVAPVVSTDPDLDPTVTIPRLSDLFDRPPPPTPPEGEVETARRGFLAPFTVPPLLLNEADVERALQRAYPPSLRDAGIGGTVRLLVDIDESGAVLGAQVGETSRFRALDAAALELADMMRFSPALNGDRTVAVRVSIPLTFEIR